MKVGDLVKTLIGDIDEGWGPLGVTEAGETGLVVEIELMFGSKNKLYSVKFNDGQVIPYYRCDLKVLSNV
jgi:hypothetical protein